MEKKLRTITYEYYSNWKWNIGSETIEDDAKAIKERVKELRAITQKMSSKKKYRNIVVN